VGLLGLVVLALNLWWVAGHREPGSYDVDETGYLATAFGIHRSLVSEGPLAGIAAAFHPSPSGPLVPLLAGLALSLLPTTLTTALAVQGVLVVVAAVAAAGIVSRLGSHRSAILTGLIVCALPAMLCSARTFQFASAAAAGLLLATWALFASQRGTRRWPMAMFGAAVGAMLLARTMTIAFLPALALMAGIEVRKDRHGLTNSLVAGVTAVAVAGPWWFRSRSALTDYLLGYGYGRQEASYTSGSRWSSAAGRLATALGDVRPPLVVVGMVVLLLALRSVMRRRRTLSPLTDSSRRMLCVAAGVAAGYAALFTTTNQGVWFELPVELLLVVLVVACGSHLMPAPRRRLAVAASGIAILALLASAVDHRGRYELSSPGAAVQLAVFGGIGFRETDIWNADGRFSSPDRDTQRAAAREWWLANLEIARSVRDVDPTGRGVITVVGSSHLVNGNTMLLAAELSGTTSLDVEEPDTTLPTADLERYVLPREQRRQRVIVVMRPHSAWLPKGRGTDAFAALAHSRDWLPLRSLALPDGGHVELLGREADVPRR
jgi:4-amino-4-deoxy-L-arabinose transferase-like glycosyltransferase